MRSHTRPAAASSPSSYSKNSNTRQEHPHLSGAHIGSMVKQLRSSSSTARSKGQNFNTAMGSTPHDQQQPQQDDQQHRQQDQQQEQAPATPLVALQPVQVKKQVRRRLHTSRPYQERLLDMAEARREIVTALKIHRATMRQAKDQREQQLLQQQQHQQQQVQVPLQEQSQAVRATAAIITPMSTVSYDAFFSSHFLNSPLALAHLMAGSGTSYSSSSTLPYLTPVALAPPNNGGLDHLACSRPAQPLGLNLSFQGFNGLVYDGENNNNSFNRPLIQPSPASSCSAYSSPSAAMASHGSPAVDTAENAPSPAPLHPVLEDEEMAAIFSIGERRSDEWSDTVEVSTPAWWSKLLLDQSTEDGGGGVGAAAGQEGGTVGFTGNVVGMPAGRLCDGLGEQMMVTVGSKPDGVLEMHLGDYYYHRRQGDSDGEDITLPW